MNVHDSKDNLVVSIPRLHRDERLAALCPEVKWISPGLEQAACLPVDWPFEPEVVKDIVHELERVSRSGMTGEEVRAVHLLEQATVRAREELREVRGALGLDELAGAHFGDTARQAQRYLLFVWFQEEQQLEIVRLSRAYAEKSRVLGQMLGDEEAGGTVLPMGNLYSHLPDWKQVMERIALFLSPSATLVTEDLRIVNELQERGFCLEPLEKAGIDCPDALEPVSHSLCGQRIELWRMLGYPGIQRNKPWLDMEYSLILIKDMSSDA